MALVDDLTGWGYMAQGQQMRDAFNGWSPDSYQSAIPKNLLEGIVNNGWRTAPDATTGAGQFSISRGQTTYNSDPNGNPLPSTTAPDEINYHPQGQGPGENYYVYDTSGKYLRMDKGSKVQSYASGVLSVLGAAVGANVAFGGAGAGGYSAGGAAGGGGAGAGAAAGGAAGGAVGGAGAATAGGGASFGLSPEVFTTPTLAEGAGLSGASGSGAFFGNPALWSGAVPEGVGYGLTPTLAPAVSGAPRALTPGGPGSPGGPGGPAATAPAKTALESLGGTVMDKLGGQLVSAAGSSFLGSLLSPKSNVSPPTLQPNGTTTTSSDTVTKAISAMPDPLAQQRAKKRSLIEQLGRRGRSSTVLTTPGRLGG